MRLARAPLIAGNWKLNHSPSETADFFRRFLPALAKSSPGTIAFFPPAISFAAAKDALGGHDQILLGVQNVYWETTGAFTGEISAPLARDAGASLVLVGHSERRHVFGESDDDTARKTGAVIEAGLTVVLCVGEQIDERESGLAEAVVSRQLAAALSRVGHPSLDQLVVAYEPVWAIGTGRTATPDDATRMHAHVRRDLDARFGPDAAGVPILYGGSVKPDNAAELLHAPDVDGLLVGGASLDPESFAVICAAAG